MVGLELNKLPDETWLGGDYTNGWEGLDLNKYPDGMRLGGDDANGEEVDVLSCTNVPPVGGYTIVEGVGKSPTMADQVCPDAGPGVLGTKKHVVVPNDGTISSVSAPNSRGLLKVPRTIFETRWRRCTRNNKEGKTKTPKVDNVVRRNTRSSNDGYLHPGLPDTRRSASTVPKASTPAVLQISEMQRLGVEECHIDHEDLLEACLLESHRD